MTVLPTTYWGPAAWFEAYASARVPVIEVCDSFPKQTLRNRCVILSPAGERIMLTVPLCKVESKQLTRDIRISYQQHWQHQHLTAIMSAYKKSPYYDYYADFISPLYERQYTYLLDLNDATAQVALSLLRNEMPAKEAAPLARTTEWQHSGEEVLLADETSILDRLFKNGPLAMMK